MLHYGLDYFGIVADLSDLSALQDVPDGSLVVVDDLSSTGINVRFGTFRLDTSSVDTYSMISGVVVPAHVSLGGNWLRQDAYINVKPVTYALELVNQNEDAPSWVEIDLLSPTQWVPLHSVAVHINPGYEHNGGRWLCHFRSKGSTGLIDTYDVVRNVQANATTYKHMVFPWNLGNVGKLERQTESSGSNNNNLVVPVRGFYI